MKILIFNWRDLKNPFSGGAEILTHEIAKRLVKKGHNVVIFTSYFRGAKREEVLDGVRIIREGHPDARALFASVQYKGYQYYKKNPEFDLVIDEVHGIPFFTPLFVKGKKIAFICELAGNLWNSAVIFPFNVFGRAIELIYPLLYKNIQIVTISESSKKDLQKAGFKKISILPMGSGVPVVKKLSKKDNTILVFLARVSKVKGIEDAIRSISILKEKVPDIKLLIIGRTTPNYQKFLEKYAGNLNVLSNIKFLNFLTEEEKIRILDKSYLIVIPSQKEGWGLTVHEAGARGTPAVVYNVNGLRDVVKNNINGLVCSKNIPEDLADKIYSLIIDRDPYKKLQKGAIEERKKHNWNNTVSKFLEIIK